MSTKEGDFGKDAAILKELREISNKHSPYTGSNSNTTASKEAAEEPNKRPRLAALSPSAALSEKENSSENVDGTTNNNNNGGTASNEFLHRTGENRNLNQYWYSKNTIEVLCSAIREALSISKGSRVAFLSTPSLFFSLSSKEREHCALFDVSSLIEGILSFAAQR